MEISSNQARQRRAKLVTIFFAVPILALSGLGFVAKFIEFIHAFESETEGVFAITPMANYLLASAGFFCLLVWATLNGMFDEIEGPKRTMLENDVALDQRTRMAPDASVEPRVDSRSVTHSVVSRQGKGFRD